MSAHLHPDKWDYSISSSTIDEFNIFHKNPDHQLRKDIRPCYFSGNILRDGLIAVLSLNPKYTQRITEAEHHGLDDDAWHNHSINRFMRYPRDQDINRIFKDIWKIVQPDGHSYSSVREGLQATTINLDWCPYYSQQFPTISFDKYPLSLQKAISTEWTDRLARLVSSIKPRLIFAHGRAQQHWVNRYAHSLKPVTQVHCFKGDCTLWSGSFNRTPLIYLEHFISHANRADTVANIRRSIKSITGLPGL